MADEREEVRLAIRYALETLKPLTQKNPDAPIRGAADDFNALLNRAQKAFPESRTIAEMGGLLGGANLVTLVTRLSVLKAATAEGSPYTHESTE